MLEALHRVFQQYLNVPLPLLFASDHHLPTDVLRVKFELFPSWLESSLREVSHEELIELNFALDAFTDTIATMQQLSKELRSSLQGVVSQNQVNKVQKLADQIDQLKAPYLVGDRMFITTAMRCQVSSTLPDFESLKDYIARMKPHLKLIDDMAFSKKAEIGGKHHGKGSKGSSGGRNTSGNNNNSSSNGGSSGNSSNSSGGGSNSSFIYSGSSSSGGERKVSELSQLRATVRSAEKQLELINAEVNKRELVLQYFAEIKCLVHLPLQECSLKIRGLPQLPDMRSFLDAEYDALRRFDEQYNLARRANVLVEATTTRGEAELLEGIAERSLEEGLRAAFSDELLLEIQKIMSSDLLDSATASFTSWYAELLGYMRLPLTELLKGCTRELTATSFRNAVQQLQQLMRDSPSVLTELGFISDSAIESIKAFDVELFIAYAEDWNERVVMFEGLIKRKVFIEAYEKLTNTRAAVDKARLKYERGVLLFNDAVAQHREVNAQLQLLRETYIELALSEFSQEIELLS